MKFSVRNLLLNLAMFVANAVICEWFGVSRLNSGLIVCALGVVGGLTIPIVKFPKRGEA